MRAYQEKQGLKVDGIAGPATLAKMDAFDNIDAATVAAAKATPAEAVFEAEPLPEINGTEVVASAAPAAEAPVVQVAETSVWGRIKGWF